MTRTRPIRGSIGALLALMTMATACGSDPTVSETPIAEAPAQTAAEPEAAAPEAEEPEPEAAPEAEEPEPEAVEAAPEAEEPEPEAVEAAPEAEEPEPEAAPESELQPAAEAVIDLPDVQVVDLKTQATLALDDLARPGPTLVWFWAPH